MQQDVGRYISLFLLRESGNLMDEIVTRTFNEKFEIFLILNFGMVNNMKKDKNCN